MRMMDKKMAIKLMGTMLAEWSRVKTHPLKLTFEKKNHEMRKVSWNNVV